MTTPKSKTAVLEIFAPFKEDGRDKLIRVGTMFHTERGKTMINIESMPTKCGDWDGKSYLCMKPDNSDLTDVYPSRTSESGSALPVFEVKAVFNTVEGRGNRTNYVNCGIAFLGRVRDDNSVKSIVLTLSSKPTGDTGDWDKWTYVGFPLENRQAQEDKKPKSRRSQKPAEETEVVEAT